MATPRGRGRAFMELAAAGRNTFGAYAQVAAAVILVPSVAAVILAFTAGSGPVGRLIQQYAPIAVAGAVLIWSVQETHRRPWRTLISAGTGVDGRRIAIGAGVQLAIMGGQLLLVDALAGWTLDLSLAVGWPVLLLALVLVPLQAGSEELLFRGYLTQALGRILRSRIVLALLVGAAFGVLHFDTHGALTLPYFLLLSLLFSLVSLRDEGLELTIGGHAAMNLFAFAAANSALVAAAGAVGDTPAEMLQFNAAAILVLLVDGVLFYGLTRLLVRLFCRPRAL